MNFKMVYSSGNYILNNKRNRFRRVEYCKPTVYFCELNVQKDTVLSSMQSRI